MTHELEQLIAEGPAPVPEWPAGFLPRDGSGHGAGFSDGGALDGLAPGVSLAGFADDAHRRLADVDDDSLIGVLRGWRRLAAWAQARELATITELARRRPAGNAPPAPPGQLPARMSEFVADEVALALTLTSRAADTELGLALGLADRPATFAALEAGRIDLTRAKIIIEGVSTLDARHADAVEAAVVPRAPGLTTGQLGAAVARAVLAVDPQAARRRRKDTEKCAQVDCWPEPYGTASLAGWRLPSAQALAADERLCQIAAAWRKQGAAGEPTCCGPGLIWRCCSVCPSTPHPPTCYPPPTRPSPAAQPRTAPSDITVRPGGTTPAAGSTVPDPGSTAPGSAGPPAARRAPVAATWQPGYGRAAPRRPRQRPAAAGRAVNLTVPLTTLLGLDQAPGQAAGYGPLDADTAGALACAAAGHRATRWQITVTAPDGTALAHGTAARRSGVTASNQEAPGDARRHPARRRPGGTGQAGGRSP